MLEFGDVFPAAWNVYDADGDPANAAAVSLTITQPDGTVVTPGITNPPDVEGQYSYPFITTQTGRHIYSWQTADPVTSYTDVFDVADPMTSSILSLADAKIMLDIDPAYTANDNELRFKLRATTIVLEGFKHEAIAMRPVTEWAHLGGFGWPRVTPALRLLKIPIHSVISIVAYGPTGNTLTTYWPPADGQPDPVYVDKSTGLVRVLNGPPLAGRVRSDFFCGYSVIPENYQQAAAVVLQHLWETRRGPGGVGGVVGPEELQDYRHYSDIPRKAREWLGPPIPVVM
jgi:hypothetical protein